MLMKSKQEQAMHFSNQNFTVHTAWKWSIICSPSSEAFVCLYIFFIIKISMWYTVVHNRKIKTLLMVSVPVLQSSVAASCSDVSCQICFWQVKLYFSERRRVAKLHLCQTWSFSCKLHFLDKAETVLFCFVVLTRTCLYFCCTSSSFSCRDAISSCSSLCLAHAFSFSLWASARM